MTACIGDKVTLEVELLATGADGEISRAPVPAELRRKPAIFVVIDTGGKMVNRDELRFEMGNGRGRAFHCPGLAIYGDGKLLQVSSLWQGIDASRHECISFAVGAIELVPNRDTVWDRARRRLQEETQS